MHNFKDGVLYLYEQGKLWVLLFSLEYYCLLHSRDFWAVSLPYNGKDPLSISGQELYR